MVIDMKENFFLEQAEAWKNIPIDDVGYFNTEELMMKSDDVLKKMIIDMEKIRYNEGYRNWGNKWRSTLKLDTTHGKRVLDYGCGSGIEALQYAKTGNHVYLADINASNISLAEKILKVFGFKPIHSYLITNVYPFTGAITNKFDIVHMNGVLHHIFQPYPVVRAIHESLINDGELRLMLYSDIAWRIATNTEPPEDVTNNPMRKTFVRTMDGVGEWADWYDADRIEKRFGSLFTIEEFSYITSDDRYCTAILKRKEI